MLPARRIGLIFRDVEFRYGEFVRALPLPPGVKEEDIKASYKDGILEVRVPVGTETESSVKRIPVART